MRTSTPFFLALAVGLGLWSAPLRAQVDATVNCSATPTGHVEWPADNPVWSFDFIRPQNSSGSDGSGLELRDVYYNGRLVFKRAHTPVLNVEYDGSGCSCFRDWADSEAGFATDGIRAGSESCFADATAGNVITTCDLSGGGDAGSFRGIAAEEFDGPGGVRELVLTSHMSAGWYRYRIKWHFYSDGRVWPEFSFAAASATCTSQAHRHHVYWRFDFDIDGADGDVIREVNPTAGTETALTTEAARTWGNPADGIYWTVSDNTTGAGYQVVPSAADLLLPVDAFSKTDALALRYNASEIDDGSSSCAINYNSMVNGQAIAGEDVVFWYRSGALHTGGNPWECDIVGPTLVPFGAIPVELVRFDAQLLGNQAARLAWTTASETNNSGFEVEHRVDGGAWASIGFVEGHGTTTEARNYTFTTDALQGGVHTFRLKQVDFDGQFEYSHEVEVAVDVPGSYVLERAYPNPFNPTTTVRFKVAQAQEVTLALYDALGRRVAELFSGYAEANRYATVQVDGSALPSGTYTVRLEGETVHGATRVVLVK